MIPYLIITYLNVLSFLTTGLWITNVVSVLISTPDTCLRTALCVSLAFRMIEMVSFAADSYGPDFWHRVRSSNA